MAASSSQDGGIDRHTSLHCTTVRKNTTNLKIKTPKTARKSLRKTPRTVWKSDNQGFKDAVLIQTGRRGGERTWCYSSKPAKARQWWPMVPHSCVVDKNQGDTL